MTTVVNKYKEPYTVYIGRGSIWGNPFSHKHGTKAEFVVESRDAAVEAYRLWLWDQIQHGLITREQLLALDGETLGCYCKPQACHGDVLIRAVEWAKNCGGGG